MDRKLHVAFLATECVPFVKVGGLADVIGALPAHLAARGARVDVVIPRFGDPDPDLIDSMERLAAFPVPVGDSKPMAEVFRVRLHESKVQFFLIGDGKYFPRGGVYVDPATGRDYPDQLERWAFFQRAALELLSRESPDLDVIHCHEHQTALVPAYLDARYRRAGVFENAGTVLTVHNLGYQGIFPTPDGSVAGLEPSEIQPGGRFEYYGQINLMKGGILSADSLTVVSPTYAEEIQTETYGCGLESVIATRRNHLNGILNGIDEKIWSPETDRLIAACYSRNDLSGKAENRKAILSELGLSDDPGTGPVLAMVSRVDAHKGFDLLLPVLDAILHQPIRFILLGTGDAEIEKSIEGIVRDHPGKAAVRFGFDDALAHRIVAGADIFLMPSRYEPCGLTQMYALRYGTIPVVRATGGLADTVEEFDPVTGQGTGFRFTGYDPAEFRVAINRAIAEWHDNARWQTLMKTGMRKDFSWSLSARRYLEVYEETVSRRQRLGSK